MQTLYDIVPIWSDTNILQSDNDVRVSHRVFEDVSVLSELEQDVGSRGWREAKTHRHTLNVHRVHLNWSVMKCGINTQTLWPRSGPAGRQMTKTLPECRRGPPELVTDTSAACLSGQICYPVNPHKPHCEQKNKPFQCQHKQSFVHWCVSICSCKCYQVLQQQTMKECR